MILGAAWWISLIFNPESRRLQLAGVLLPGLFALAGGSVRLGFAPLAVAGTLGAFGLLAAAIIWASPGAGRRLYVGWMLAAQPIGWTISHLVLGAVYYLVLTPIGLIMRLLRRDPMQRRFDRAAGSFDSADFVHAATRGGLMSRLEPLLVKARTILVPTSPPTTSRTWRRSPICWPSTRTTSPTSSGPNSPTSPVLCSRRSTPRRRTTTNCARLWSWT